MSQPAFGKLATVVAVSGVGLAMSLSSAGVALAATTSYVSPSGKTGQAGTSCASAKYSVIQQAVDATPAGGTVVVCPGTYTLATQGVAARQPFVHVGKSLTLRGRGLPLLNAAGSTPGAGAGEGILITASHVRVTGFKVTGAVNEGIVAEPLAAFLAGNTETPSAPVAPITAVTVSHNVVTYNNKGFQAEFCSPTKDYPEDCGGGLHFNAVAHSTMSFNRVTNNADGILVTDDAGPAHHNLILANRVLDNTIECGITLPSHGKGASVKQNPDGSFTETGRTPATGGVYNNVVRGNTSNGNGTHGFMGGGSGAGVLLAGGGPGTAVYNNVIWGNHVSGNGLAGVTVHAHYPGGEDLRGNSVVNNVIGRNNTLGDVLDSPGMPKDTVTTGIILFTAPRTTWKVTGNRISDNRIGIWHNAAAIVEASDNSFTHVHRHFYMPRFPFGSAACGSAPEALAGPCSTTSTTATVLGFVVPNGSRTLYHFAYGTSPTALTTVTARLSAGAGVTLVGKMAVLTGLTPNTTYYYKLVARNRFGSWSGIVMSFKTKP